MISIYEIINKNENKIEIELNKKIEEEEENVDAWCSIDFLLQRIFTVLICNFVLEIEILVSCEAWMLCFKRKIEEKKLWFCCLVRMKVFGKRKLLFCSCKRDAVETLFFCESFFFLKIFLPKSSPLQTSDKYLFIGTSPTLMYLPAEIKKNSPGFFFKFDLVIIRLIIT